MNYLKVVTDSNLKQSEKVLMIYLYENNNSGIVKATYKKLCNDLGMTKPTIIKAIKGLEGKDLMKRKFNKDPYGSISANTYIINISQHI